MSLVRTVLVLCLGGVIGFIIFTLISDSDSNPENEIIPTPTIEATSTAAATQTVAPTSTILETPTASPTSTQTPIPTPTLVATATVDPTLMVTDEIYVPPYEVVEDNIIMTDLSIKAELSECKTVTDDDITSIYCEALVQDVFYSLNKDLAISDVITYVIEDVEEGNTLVNDLKGVYFLSLNVKGENTYSDPGNGYRFKYSKELEELFIQAAQVSDALMSDEFL